MLLVHYGSSVNSPPCFFTPEVRLTKQAEGKRTLGRLACVMECSFWLGRDTCHYRSQSLARSSHTVSLKSKRCQEVQWSPSYHVPGSQRGWHIWSPGQSWCPQSLGKKERQAKHEPWGTGAFRGWGSKKETANKENERKWRERGSLKVKWSFCLLI